MCDVVQLQLWTSAALPLLAVPPAIAADVRRYVDRQLTKAAIISAVGVKLCREGSLARGLECLERAQAIYIVLGDAAAVRQVLLQMGEEHLQVGHLVPTICCYQEALSLSRGLGRVAEVEALRRLEMVYERAAMPFSAADMAQQVALLTSGVGHLQCCSDFTE